MVQASWHRTWPSGTRLDLRSIKHWPSDWTHTDLSCTDAHWRVTRTRFMPNWRHNSIESATYLAVDFIFGDARAVFQGCQLVARLPQPGQRNVLTAQGRYEANSTSGFVFQFWWSSSTWEGSWDIFGTPLEDLLKDRLHEVLHCWPYGLPPVEQFETWTWHVVLRRVQQLWTWLWCHRQGEVARVPCSWCSWSRQLHGVKIQQWLPETGVHFTPILWWWRWIWFPWCAKEVRIVCISFSVFCLVKSIECEFTFLYVTTVRVW